MYVLCCQIGQQIFMCVRTHMCACVCGGEKTQTQSTCDRVVIMVESKYKLYERTLLLGSISSYL